MGYEKFDLNYIMCYKYTTIKTMNETLNLFQFNHTKSPSGKKYMKGAEPFFYVGQSDIGVLLLHGFTSSPHQFKNLREFFIKRKITVFSPVIAGHGTDPEDLRKTSIEDWIQSGYDAFNKLKSYAKHIVIVGNSFGGNIAFQIAVKNDEQLKGIVSLGTPIFLRNHTLITLRTYTYGWMKKYYKKRGKHYHASYGENVEVISYPVIPVRSLRNFLRFIKYFTIPNIQHVTTPVLLIQGNRDQVVHPKSVQFLHQHLKSEYKKVCWLDGPIHSIYDIQEKEEFFHLIFSFIQEVTGIQNQGLAALSSKISTYETNHSSNNF